MKEMTYVLYINGELSTCPEDEFGIFTDAMVACSEYVKEDRDIGIVEIRRRVVEEAVLYTHERNCSICS